MFYFKICKQNFKLITTWHEIRMAVDQKKKLYGQWNGIFGFADQTHIKLF